MTLFYCKQIWFNYLIHGVDVLVVAYIFYRMLLLVRGTRSVQVLMGIFLIAVSTLVVNGVLKLPTSSWLFEKFWMAGIIILAIVFQPEIRSALAQLGARPISRWLMPSRFDFIDETVAALKECSEKRIGALIVLEQEVGLKNYIETGTKINADISTEIIISILHPKSPLHDGAIIISGNQLTAAGCVLPLTDDPHFAKLLGTRHRAAVGLSECSDALILVVSEESGQIALVREGRMQRDIDLDEIKKQIHSLFREKENRTLLRRAEEEQTKL